MRHLSTWILLLSLTAVPSTVEGGSGHRHHRDNNISISTHGNPTGCSDIDIDAGRRAVATGEQSLTAPAHVALAVPAAPRGGVVVSGWDGRDFQVIACKAAVAADLEQARQRLAAISVAIQGNAVETSGPADEDWLVYLIIRTPRDAALNLTVRNGPLSLYDATGRFTIEGSNGPVSLEDVAGTISVELENGPVSIANGGGDVRVRTENGPIAVSLDGDEWEGEGLDARAINGPLSLEIAPGYKGGVRIESSGNAPWSCGELCSQGDRSWDGQGRQLEIGPQPARIRLSTVNGPVSIGE
jgi:hypothetical protein